MAARKRRRRSSREVAIAQVVKAARTKKLALERELSAMLGEALGLDVTVKLKPKAISPAAARAKRQTKTKSGVYYDDLEEILDGPNAVGVEALKRIQ